MEDEHQIKSLLSFATILPLTESIAETTIDLRKKYKEDFAKSIQLLTKEKFTLDKRELIEISGCNNCFGEVNYALNEFTIHKKDSSAMINIDTYIDGVFLNSYLSVISKSLINLLNY